MNTPSFRHRPGFTLIELLVVMAVIGAMMALSVPAITAIRGGTDFTTGVYNIAGSLEQARTYAMSNNTYVLVGIAEVSASQDSSVASQTPGVGRIAMAIVASKTGARPYQALINSNQLATWQTTQYNNNAFVAVTKLLVAPNMHMVDLQSTGLPSFGSSTPANMARSPVTTYNNLSYPPPATTSGPGTSSTGFVWPLGDKFLNSAYQYKFYRVIEFDPQGCARVISTSNPSSYPDAVPQYIEIGLQPAHGSTDAGAPASQVMGAGQIAAIQINGISGAVHTYRP